MSRILRKVSCEAENIMAAASFEYFPNVYGNRKGFTEDDKDALKIVIRAPVAEPILTSQEAGYEYRGVR